MKINAKWGWFTAFTALYAVCAAFIFWGTWSLNFAPVMPDCAVSHPLTYRAVISEWFENWCQTGKFVPDDLKIFLGSPYFWQELQYAFAGYMAALGMFYFLRGRRVLRPIAYAAGLCLAFSGYWFSLFSAGHLGWFRWMTYGVFAFGLADRAVRKGRLRHWLLLGATVAWGSFYQPDLWLLETLLTAAYFIYCVFREHAWQNFKKLIGGVLIAAFTFALVAAPSIQSAFVNDLAGRDKQIEESKGSALTGGAESSDTEARWIFATNWSMPPEDTLEFFISRIHGDTSCQMTQHYGKGRAKPYTGRLGRAYQATTGNYRQHALYVGWVTCLFACVGFVFIFLKRSPYRREMIFFMSAAFLCWLFSMGRYCEGVYRLIYALPFGDYLRAPVKWHHLTELALVALAGFGAASWVTSDWGRGFYTRLLVGVLLIWGVGDLAHINSLYCAPMNLTSVREMNPAVKTILAQGDGDVWDLVNYGFGPLSWCFNAHGIKIHTSPEEENVRWAWVPQEAVRRQPELMRFLNSRQAEVADVYRVSTTVDGRYTVRSVADARQANIALYKFPNVPLAPKKGVNKRAVTLGIVSLLATLFVGGVSLISICRKSSPYL